MGVMVFFGSCVVCVCGMVHVDMDEDGMGLLGWRLTGMWRQDEAVLAVLVSRDLGDVLMAIRHALLKPQFFKVARWKAGEDDTIVWRLMLDPHSLCPSGQAPF